MIWRNQDGTFITCKYRETSFLLYCYFNYLNFLYIATGSFSKHSVQFLLHTRFAGVCWDWKQTGTGPRIYSLHENTNSRVVQCVKQCISLYWEGQLGRTVAMSFTRFKVSVIICQTLLSSLPSFAVVCTPGHHLLSSVLPHKYSPTDMDI